MNHNEQNCSYLVDFFAYTHLPEHLQLVSRPFCDLAWELYEILPASQQLEQALQKLLEAKDAAVRAKLGG